MEIKVVSDRLRHSQISVTADLYTHVSRRLGNAAAEQIAVFLSAPYNRGLSVQSGTFPDAFLTRSPVQGSGRVSLAHPQRIRSPTHTTPPAAGTQDRGLPVVRKWPRSKAPDTLGDRDIDNDLHVGSVHCPIHRRHREPPRSDSS